jgi:histidinol-phosphate aminotransferase
MTGNTALAAGIPFPVLARMSGVARMERDHRPGELNLKSCELLNQSVLDWQAGKIAALGGDLVVRYPLTTTARAATAAAYDREPGSVLLTPGTDHAIQLVAEALGAPAGRIVIADPWFDGWTRGATRFGVRLDSVPAEPGVAPTVEPLIGRMRSGAPCVVVLTQPDGISGHSFSAAELSELSAAAAAHGSVLVIDTCYIAFTDEGDVGLGGIDRHPHVIRINSFSKCFGLAGARVGAVFAAAPVADYLSRWNAESLVNGIGLYLLTEALRDRSFFAGVYQEVRQARTGLARSVPPLMPGWLPRPSQANFVAFDVPAGTGGEAVARLRWAGIRTKPLTEIAGFLDGVRIAAPSAQAVRRVISAFSD